MKSSPLSAADLSNLRKAIVQLQDTQQQIDAAKQAGIDVSEHEQRQTHLNGLAQGLISTYGRRSDGGTAPGGSGQ
jgi:hypothetical protein